MSMTYDMLTIMGMLSMTMAAAYFSIGRVKMDSFGKLHFFLSFVGAFSALFLAYNLFTNIRFNKIIEKNRSAYNTIANIQQLWLEPQKSLVSAYPEGYRLYASMNQDMPWASEDMKGVDAAKREQLETYTSIRLFQAVEDFLTIAAFDMTGNYVWINNFVMWMQSPILQRNWKVLGFNFSDDTREMMERIIIEANKLSALRKSKGKLTFADYDKVSKIFKIIPR